MVGAGRIRSAPTIFPIYRTDAVEGRGKPVVLIHEMGGTMESWSLVAPLLSGKRWVVRYDTRGAGFSGFRHM